MDPEYARKKALMDWIVDGMAGRHYPKPALPENYQPNEIFHYSPPLKTTGGYSYAPPVAKEESPMAKPKEPRKYQPNFLSPFGIPEASEEPQEEERQGQETIKRDDKKHPQGRLCFVGSGVYVVSADNKTIRSINGRTVTDEIKRMCGVIQK